MLDDWKYIPQSVTVASDLPKIRHVKLSIISVTNLGFTTFIILISNHLDSIDTIATH
jgi:16S rRNA U1498 N3-methylase RsmE